MLFIWYFFHFAPKYVLGGETKQWSFLPTVCFSLAREGTGQYEYQQKVKGDAGCQDQEDIYSLLLSSVKHTT